jgi:hypothetical protein
MMAAPGSRVKFFLCEGVRLPQDLGSSDPDVDLSKFVFGFKDSQSRQFQLVFGWKNFGMLSGCAGNVVHLQGDRPIFPALERCNSDSRLESGVVRL